MQPETMIDEPYTMGIRIPRKTSKDEVENVLIKKNYGEIDSIQLILSSSADCQFAIVQFKYIYPKTKCIIDCLDKGLSVAMLIDTCEHWTSFKYVGQYLWQNNLDNDESTVDNNHL